MNARRLVPSILFVLGASALPASVAAQVKRDVPGLSKQHLTIYVSMVGTKLQFPGDGIQKSGKKPSDFEAVSLTFEGDAPHDAATGRVVGRRVYKPLYLIHEVDAVTPQIENALAKNELLKSVDITLIRPDPNGMDAKYFSIRLEDATIASVRQFTDENGHFLEEVGLHFQKIEAKGTATNLAFVDDTKVP
jgi:type VI secretion system secreted protein Hcp